MLWVLGPCAHRGRIGADMAFIMLVHRLHSYCKLQQVALFWGQSADRICRWTNYMAKWLVERWGHLLTFSHDLAIECCEEWAEKIATKMAADDVTLGRLIGFLDGTFRSVRSDHFSPAAYHHHGRDAYVTVT